jgi:hypothetical protein
MMNDRERMQTTSGKPGTYTDRFSRSRRYILIVVLIWLVQAIPKWYVAITADGELSARIMKVFVAPRTMPD